MPNVGRHAAPPSPTQVLLGALRLPLTPSSVGDARAFTATLLRGYRVHPSVCETSVLLVSELVTNAIQHALHTAAASALLTLTRTGELLRIEVADPDPRMPAKHDAFNDDESGRGLIIVEWHATRWGAESTGDGKRVFCEIPMNPTNESE
jgi:anti-sigma regulatory factor (Ser/Thr protein kinase)